MADFNPTDIVLHQASHLLEISFDNGAVFKLPYEYLRVFSPSAEVRGHGKGQEVLQTNKKEVGVENIEVVGNYAVKINFDDGHNTGLYTWDYLFELGEHQESNWQMYLARLDEAGATR
ncbi:MAG: gamma-butyrobetaine hydroxylase-like domain-containing protein [Gammaproteobacteria bacterium]